MKNERKMDYSLVIRAENEFHKYMMDTVDCPMSAYTLYMWLIREYNRRQWELTDLGISDRALASYMCTSHATVQNGRKWLVAHGFITYEVRDNRTRYKLVFFDNYLARHLPDTCQILATRLPLLSDKSRQDAIENYSSSSKARKIKMIDEREAGMGELREDSENGVGLIAESDANASEARIPDTSYTESTVESLGTKNENHTVKEETYSGRDATSSQYASATKDTDELSAAEYAQLAAKALKANVSLEDRVFQEGTYEYFKAHLSIRELNTLASFETPENIDHLKEVYETHGAGMGCPLAYLRTTAKRYDAAQATKRRKQAERAAKLADRAGSSAPKASSASDKPPYCSKRRWQELGEWAERICNEPAVRRESEFERDLRNDRDLWIPTSDKRDNYDREEKRQALYGRYYSSRRRVNGVMQMYRVEDLHPHEVDRHIPAKGTAARRYWNWVYRDEDTSDPHDAACRALWRVWKEGEPVPPLKYDEPAQVADNVSITADSIADSDISITADSIADNDVSITADSIADSDISIIADSIADSEVSITADSIADSDISITADSIADSDISIIADSIADSEVSITAADYDMVVEPDFSTVKTAFETDAAPVIDTNETSDAAQIVDANETSDAAPVIDTNETSDAAQIVDTNEEPAQVPTVATISPYSSTDTISYERVRYNYLNYDKPVDNPLDAQIRAVFRERQAEFDAAKPHTIIDDLTKDSAQECKTFIERLMYNHKHCYEPTDNPYDLYQRLICQQSKAKIAEEKRVAEEERKRREAADAAWQAKLAAWRGEPVKKTDTPKRPASTPIDEDYIAAKEAEEAAKTPEEREAEIERRVTLMRADNGDEEARVKALTEILVIPGADAPYRERFVVAQHRECYIRYKREDYEIVELADRTIEFRKGSALASINKGGKSEVYLCDGYKVIYPDGAIEDFTDAEKHAI